MSDITKIKVDGDLESSYKIFQRIESLRKELNLSPIGTRTMKQSRIM